MWLPNAFYNRAPQYWMFVGVLLVVLGVYLGVEMDHPLMFVGIGAGAISFLWGLRIYLRRSAHQQPVKSVGNTSIAD